MVSQPSFSQVGNTQPPSSTSGVGQSGGPFDNNTANNGSSNGTATADASGDPGGPTNPPSDLVPIDGGVSILLALGLVHGYLITKRRKKAPKLAYSAAK